MTVIDFFLVFTNGFGVISGLLLVVFLIQKEKITDKIFALLILAVTLRIFKSLVYYFYPSLDWSIINLVFAVKLSIGPLLRLYFKHLFNKNLFSKLLETVHFIPAVIFVLFAIPITHDTLNPFGFLLIYFQFLGYLIYGYRVLKKEDESEKKRWAKTLLHVLLLIWFAYFFQMITKLTHYLLASFLFSLSLFYIAIKSQIVRTVTKLLQHDEKYESSKLNKETKANLLVRLESYIKEKPYLNNEVSLAGFAEKLGATPHELSQLINTHFETNFNGFINQFRIEEAKRLLKTSNEKIAAIAFDIGFNSLSTFNTTFKKLIGYTPSEFRKNLSKS